MEDEYPIFMAGGLIILAILIAFYGVSFTPGVTGRVPSVPIFTDRAPEDLRFVGLLGSTATLSKTDDFSVEGQESVKDIDDMRLFNGVFFGGNEIRYSIEEDADNVEIKFRVSRTNMYAPMTIKLNDKIIEQKEYELGEYSISVNGGIATGSTIEIKPLSSTWKIWAPTVYDLEDISVVTNARGNNELHFSLNGELAKFKDGRIDLLMDENIGQLEIILNGNLLSTGFVDNRESVEIEKEQLVEGDNELLFRTEDGTFSGEASVVIFYEVIDEKKIELPFRIDKNVHDNLKRGFINFNIADIQKPGGMVVKIKVGSQVLFRQFMNVEERPYSIIFGKQDSRPGTNELIIESVDGAAFSVANIEVSV